ncbi:MAG: hypothetical protein GYA24_23670 [Candidatus Lokiarchaeota archaeon]|nr:hypothetical protein [Candidatus Lokiarchaeota archaeon]
MSKDERIEKKVGQGTWTFDLNDLASAFGTGKNKETVLKARFLNVLLIRLDATEEIPPHYEDYDAVFYVIEGEGQFTIGDSIMTGVKGMLINAPKEQNRGIRTTSSVLILGLQEPH